MIKSICQNPFHRVIASSLLQRNDDATWVNIFVKNLYFLNPMSLKSEAFVFTMTQLSTFSGASSLWSDNIACNWKDSFTFTACHWDCKDNPDQKSKKRKCFLVVLPPIQLVNVWGSIWDNLFICWALILEPSCGCGGHGDNDKDWWKWCDLTSTRSRNKNPEKSRDFSFKNPRILADLKSRDPGIPGIPLGPGRKSLRVIFGSVFKKCGGGR